MSVGIMASAVDVAGRRHRRADGAVQQLHRRPVDARPGRPTIVAGRTGTAAQSSGTPTQAVYTIPAGVNESDTLTIGFAYRRQRPHRAYAPFVPGVRQPT